jgi:catechol-2,3-dioxygenase
MERVHPSKFAHVVYRTRRFEEMLDWYRLVFNARVQFENPALAFLTYDDEHHRFAFANLDLLQPGGGDADERGMIGVDHVAYTYASLADLLDNYRFLRDRGVRPYWCVHHGLSVSMYYADPDGNQTEFQVDVFETGEEAADYLRGPITEANPVGVEYDPEDWLTRIDAGTPIAELLKRKVHEPISPIRGALAS